MIETPQILTTPVRDIAVIHLTVPASEIRNVMGPGLQELKAGVEAQAVAIAGPWFTHHLKNPDSTFDFEIGLPVSSPVNSPDVSSRASGPPYASLAPCIKEATKASPPLGVNSSRGSRTTDTSRPKTYGRYTRSAPSPALIHRDIAPN